MKIRHIASIFLAAAALSMQAGTNFDFSSRKAVIKSLETAEATLGNPSSPEHNEAAYLEVLQKATGSSFLDENDKLRPQLLLENALKNKIGAKATDIEYVLPDGTQKNVLDGNEKYTLIYFNDPDCEACAMVKERLDTCSILRNLAENGTLKVIGIYTMDNEKAWKEMHFPDYIENGWDKNQMIDSEETYVLPTMPLFYLLDFDKNVLLKNEPSLNNVLDYLSRESNK